MKNNNLPLWKKSLFIVIIAITGAVLVFGIVEVTLRLINFQYHGLHAAINSVTEFDKELCYRFKQSESNALGFHTKINKWGYRGEDWNEEKTSGTLRIAAIGDSATFGLYNTEDQTWPALLQKKLRDSGIDCEVLNMGVLAYSSFQNRKDYELNGCKFNPDIIVLLLGNWNDYHCRIRRPDLTDKEFHDLGLIKKEVEFYVPWYVFCRTGQLIYSFMEKIDTIKIKRNDRKLTNIGYYLADKEEFKRRVSLAEFKDNLKFFADEGKRRDIPVIFITPQLNFKDTDKKTISKIYSGEVNKMGVYPNVSVIDIVEYLKNCDQESIWYDSCHFKPEGCDIIAETLLQKIKDLDRNKKL